jgi:CBS domain-containing protein
LRFKVEQTAVFQALRGSFANGWRCVASQRRCRVELISSLVSRLNPADFARLWSFVAPAELVANSCLIVMGSLKGRGEQITQDRPGQCPLLLRERLCVRRAPTGVQR